MLALTLLVALLVLLAPVRSQNSVPVAAPEVETNLWCSICELIVELGEDFITDETTVNEVEEWLEGVCTLLPSFLERECDKFIESKVDDLVTRLLSDLPPDVVCADIGVCEFQAASNSILCDVCEVIMEDLEAWLTDDATEQDIYDFLDNICDIFPDFFTATCEGIINGYVDDIVDLVMEDYPPDVVCEMIGMCGDSVELVQAQASNDIMCDICDTLMVDLEEWFTGDETEAEIEEFLNGACEYLYVDALVGLCQEVLDGFIEEIMDLIIEDYPPDVVCEMIGLCGDDLSAEYEVSLWCSICELIVELGEDFITDETTISEVEDWLDGVCDLLPSFMGRECKRFIDTKLHELAQELLNDNPPEQVCASIGACDEELYAAVGGLNIICDICETIMADLEGFLTSETTEQEIFDFLDNVCEIFPDYFVPTCDQVINEYIEQIIDLVMADYPPDVVCEMIGMCGDSVAAPVVGDSLFCTICELIVEMAENWITSDTTLTEVIEWLDGVCDLLPSFMARKCEHWVEQEIDELAQMLLDDYPADVLCADIGACDDHAIQASNDLLCVVCDAIMEALENYVSDITTEQEIEEFLDQVCEILPNSLYSVCAHVINKYVEDIIAAVMADYPPDVVCEMVGLCDAPSVPETTSSNDLWCSICDDIMEELEGWITDETTEEEIEEFLDQVCEILPRSLQRTCDHIINTKVEEILAALAADYPPDVVCEMIGMCDAPEKVAASNDILCDVCETIMYDLESFITSDTTEEEIAGFLDQICQIFPNFFEDTCEQIVLEYVDEIIGLVMADYPPDVVCEMIGLC